MWAGFGPCFHLPGFPFWVHIFDPLKQTQRAHIGTPLLPDHQPETRPTLPRDLASGSACTAPFTSPASRLGGPPPSSANVEYYIYIYTYIYIHNIHIYIWVCVSLSLSLFFGDRSKWWCSCWCPLKTTQKGGSQQKDRLI